MDCLHSLCVRALGSVSTSSDVTGPESVTGYRGRSLSVVCKYAKGYKNYKKYWCKGADWGSCETVVVTTGTEEEVKDGRTSIKDNLTLSKFTVRLESLAQQDAGIYWCAIERIGTDPGFRVNMTVLPEPSTTIAVTTAGYVSTALSTATFPVTANSAGSTNSPKRFDPMLLLPVFLVLLVLLVGALLLMWKMKKRKAAKASGDTLLFEAPNSTEGNISSVTVQPTTPPSSDQTTNHTLEVAYATILTPSLASQVSKDTECISYATLKFSAQNEQAIYANV
ncbi:CMRF35-like molecule 1 isoform X2 [Hemicordylus capensis]|uniref:CMRF35-like molecule 1 isoform X2 n=1 Tax=Hemicordylus capensis TaxID=884348 RepID=UPI002303793B|nr:CMRF35-like molecule 1 isoform X2 [Hemicordylus capensis]